MRVVSFICWSPVALPVGCYSHLNPLTGTSGVRIFPTGGASIVSSIIIMGMVNWHKLNKWTQKKQKERGKMENGNNFVRTTSSTCTKNLIEKKKEEKKMENGNKSSARRMGIARTIKSKGRKEEKIIIFLGELHSVYAAKKGKKEREKNWRIVGGNGWLPMPPGIRKMSNEVTTAWSIGTLHPPKLHFQIAIAKKILVKKK